MIALIAKDLRVAFLSLRPIAVVVAGILLGTLVIGLLPSSSIDFPPRLSVLEVARGVGVILLVAGALPAAWTSSSILLGDRVHRADALAATLPISRRWRGVAWGVAMLACYLAVVVLSWGVQESRPLVALGLATISWALGVGAASISTRWTRGPLKATLGAALVVALVLGVALASGILGGAIVVRSIDEDGLAFLERGTLPNLLEVARFGGVIVGCIAAAAAMALGGWGPLLLGRRAMGPSLTLGIMLAITALTSTAVAVRSMFASHHVRIALSLREMERSLPTVLDRGLVQTLESLFELHPDNQDIQRRDPRSYFRMATEEVVRRLQSPDAADPSRADFVQACFAMANDATRWRERHWLRQGMIWRPGVDTQTIGWSLAFAETASTLNRQFLEAEATCLLHRLLEEELGASAGRAEFNALSLTTPRSVMIADQFDRIAASGHRDAKRLRALAAALRDERAPTESTP